MIYHYGFQWIDDGGDYFQDLDYLDLEIILKRFGLDLSIVIDIKAIVFPTEDFFYITTTTPLPICTLDNKNKRLHHTGLYLYWFPLVSFENGKVISTAEYME